MMNITLGQYIEGGSLLHKTNPQVKFILLIMLISLLFVFDFKAAFPCYTALILFLAYISKIPLKSLIASLRPIWWILFFTLLFNPFFHEGEVIFSVLGLSATKEGVLTGAVMAYRFALFILMSSFLTLTTKVTELTDAVEDILKPLKLFKISPHYAAMIMSLAFRFVPTTIREYEQIVKAQKSRGVDLTEGSMVKRIKNFMPIIFPLVLFTFQRAEELSFAMEARCYNENKTRNIRKKACVKRVDYLAIFFAVFFVVCNLCLQMFLV